MNIIDPVAYNNLKANSKDQETKIRFYYGSDSDGQKGIEVVKPNGNIIYSKKGLETLREEVYNHYFKEGLNLREENIQEAIGRVQPPIKNQLDPLNPIDYYTIEIPANELDRFLLKAKEKSISNENTNQRGGMAA